MRFEPDRRLLELLVGSALYPDPDVCVRELAQNAWDAIEWRRSLADGAGSGIHIRYDPSSNWFEVQDDGIGMSVEDVEESFLRIGRDKLEALGAPNEAGEQVALFGIGVLSVFLVAQRIVMETRKLGAGTGIRLTITGLDEQIEVSEGISRDVGTTVRVFLDPDRGFSLADLPAITHKYIRHVPGVTLENILSGETQPVGDTWDTENLELVEELPSAEFLRRGINGFSEGLRREGQIVASRWTVCNAGFLVESRARDLLPGLSALGFGGEIDVHPKNLTVVLARERHQRDERWAEVGAMLLHWFVERVRRELEHGVRTPEPPILDEARRNLLIWHWAATQMSELEQLTSDLADAVREKVGFNAVEGRVVTLSQALKRLPASRLYFRRTGQRAQRERQIDDEGLPIQLREEVRDSVRTGALKARGFEVLEVGQLQVIEDTPRGAVTRRIDEVDLVSHALKDEAIRLIDISEALPEDMDLGSVEELPMLRSLLSVGGELRFARIPESKRRVVSDSAGVRYLNVNNPTVIRLLATIPRAIQNPLKRRLLEAYLGVEEFRISETRQLLLELLEEQQLGLMASGETAFLTSAAIRPAVDRLLEELKAGE